MYNFNLNTSPTVTNCTFTGNTAQTSGGGMCNFASNPTVINCIMWGNTPDEIVDDVASSTTVTYSDVQSGWGGTGQYWFGTGCIDADPCFVDTNNPDPNLWNLRLKPDSPCIDAGDTTAVPAGIFVDADGNPRVVDDPQTPDTGLSFLGVTVDMGAYEFLRSDIDRNGSVDFEDYCVIAEQWPQTSCGLCGGADLTCDGNVDFNDLKEWVNNWLAGVEPEL